MFMDPDFIWSWILWLHFGALGVWIGGLIFLSFVAAPSMHQSIVSKQVAGELVGAMLKRFNGIELVSCSLILVTSISSFHFIFDQQGRRFLIIGLIVAMGLVTAFYSFILTPKIDGLKKQMADSVVSALSEQLQQLFKHYHKTYVMMLTLNLILSFIVLYASIVWLKGIA